MNKKINNLNLSLILATLLMVGWANSGCIKDPKTDLIYGPQVSIGQIRQAWKEANGPNDSPENIHAEESILSERTQKIRGQPTLYVLNRLQVTVVERKDTTHQWQVRTTGILQNYDLKDRDKQLDPIVHEDHRCWEKINPEERVGCEIEMQTSSSSFSSGSPSFLPSPLATPSSVPFPPPASVQNPPPTIEKRLSQRMIDYLRPFEEFQKNSNNPAEPPLITYHRLFVKKFRRPPPPAVQNQPQCGGVPYCLIDVTEMEFDMVDWSRDPEGEKIHFRIVISPDVPQLARILEQCQQTSYPFVQPGEDPKKAPRFLVTSCDNIVNFLAYPKKEELSKDDPAFSSTDDNKENKCNASNKL